MVALSLNVRNPIASTNFTNIGVGVLISHNQVLTSYNPFRTIVENKTMWDKLLVSTCYGRQRYAATGGYGYFFYRQKVTCGRQVQFLPDEEIPNILWHGTDRRNCPLHDLIVFRILANITFSTESIKEYTPKKYPEKANTTIKPGLFKTNLANSSHSLGANFKVGAVLLSGKEDEFKIPFYRVRMIEYEPDDDAVVHCDVWLPKEWGYFICILNKDNYPVLGAGALLVSENKVFGVAGFVMFRGEKSIFVFTDVRPYYDLIYKTCTYSDSGQKMPEEIPALSWVLPKS